MAADSTPLLLRRRVLAIKAETTTGTDITPGAADGAIIAYNPSIKPDVPLIGRPALSTMENLTGVSGARSGTAEFEIDFAGNGAASQPLWATVLLPACGMVNTAGSFAFTSTSATVPTVTIALFENGRRRALTGAQGTWEVSLSAGEPARIKFSFKGLYADDSDVAMPTPTYPTVLPPRWASVTGVTWGAYSPIMKTALVRAGNNVIMREDANNVTGFRSALIVDRDNIGGTFQPEAALVASFDWYAALKNSTESALAMVLGTVANNIITINAPKAQVKTRDVNDRNQIVTEQIEWQPNRNASTLDSSLTMVFT